MKSILLQKLDQLQLESHQQGYLEGVFASQRIHAFFPYKREDENIFFSAAIVYFLQENLDFFSDDDQKKAHAIIKKTLKCYPSFKNFQGGITYNFFKTNPMDFFPNGKIMRHFRFFKLADDADDTAYIYLTSLQKDSNKLKRLLIKHANGTNKWNTCNLKKYRHLKTYSVYFGKNMHLETDACVICNILLFTLESNNLSIQDQDSLTYLQQIVTSKDYIKYPYLVSPCYPTTSQIAYHIARLISKHPNQPLLSDLKNKLITDLTYVIKKRVSFVNLLLYNNALLLLNVKPKHNLNYKLDKVLKQTNYFYTSAPLMIPKLWVRKLQKYPFANFLGLRTTCKGYTTMLLLEYEVLLSKIKTF